MATVLQKTFKCIEALARSPAGLTVSEAASITGLSRPATNRLLDGLSEDSIVVRDTKTKRYRLGPRLYEWANVAIQAGTPINIARKEIISLSMETGRQCTFLVLNDLETVIVERCELVDGVPVNRPVQARRRMWYETGTGKAIVAFSAAETCQSILERTYKRPGLKPPERENLEVELDEIRLRGFAVSRDIRPAGQVGIVIPIFDRSGYAVAAVGSFMLAADLEDEAGMTLVSKMTATASRISHYLGFEEQTFDSVS